MTATRNCPTCHAPVPPDAPQGVCPACLLRTDPALGPDAATQSQGSPDRRTPPPAPSEIAPHFPQLEILELIGQGGMGVVYKARQTRLDRVVALKILAAEAARHPTFAERFGREARAMAKLGHPGIVTIYDFGSAGPYPFLIMEFVDGANLQQTIRAGLLQPAAALGLVMQICEALQFAHDQGIVHRDIKPGNILIDRSGRVKIADFGLAKLLDPSLSDGALTADHQVMGTPHYMAPEQISNPLSVDHRADIYSLGVVFYEMLTGNLPIGRFEPPSRRVHIDVRLDEVVLRTLEQAPARRYQQARDVGTDVASLRPAPPGVPPEAGVRADRPPTAPADRKAWWTGHRQGLVQVLGWTLLGIYLLGLLGFFGFESTSSNTGLRRQVGYPTPWIHWETRFLDANSGHQVGLTFPAWSWLVLGVAWVAYFARRRLIASERPLRWTDTIAHYLLWGMLFLGAVAFTAAPLLPLRQAAMIRETPPSVGHVGGGVRWSHYAFEAPANHRVTFWLEWLKNGQPATLPDVEFKDILDPARGRKLKGHLDFILQMEGRTRKADTNLVEWQWGVRASDVTTGARGIATNPFLGLPRTDSSYGHAPVQWLRPGEELTILVVRGDAEQLVGEPWDPRVVGRADLEMRLKARLDPVLPEHLRETPAATTTPAPERAGAR